MVSKLKSKTNNPVAKQARRFNKSVVFKDRKQSHKRGYIKHKGRQYERPCFLVGRRELILIYRNLIRRYTPKTYFLA